MIKKLYEVKLNSKGMPNFSTAQEVPQRTGRWEIYVISMLDGEGCRCSECSAEGAPYWDFCPNCGSYNGGNQEDSE